VHLCVHLRGLGALMPQDSCTAPRSLVILYIREPTVWRNRRGVHLNTGGSPRRPQMLVIRSIVRPPGGRTSFEAGGQSEPGGPVSRVPRGCAV
jgi:hypothetical protein